MSIFFRQYFTLFKRKLRGRDIPFLGSGSWTLSIIRTALCEQPELVVVVTIDGALRCGWLNLGRLYVYKNGVEALRLEMFKFRFGFSVVNVRVRIWVGVLPMRFHDLKLLDSELLLGRIRHWFGSHKLFFFCLNRIVCIFSFVTINIIWIYNLYPLWTYL